MSELTLKQIENKKYILEKNLKELIDNFSTETKLNFEIDLDIIKEKYMNGETKVLTSNPKVKVII